MFNFFKRSKKDGSNKKADSSAPNCAIVTSGVVTPNFGLLQNPTNAAVSSGVTVALEKNDPTNNETKMGENNFSFSYSSALKKPEQRSSGVKPCGHGTTAIHVPFVSTAAKRELVTPPASPVEKKKLAKVVPLERQTSCGKNEGNIIKSNVLVNGDAETKNLINQEAKFQSQLNDLSKQLSIRDAEANKLRFQMDELQRDVFAKSAGSERLEAELQAAHKECEILRQRVSLLEGELQDFRNKNNEAAEEIKESNESFTNYENETNNQIIHLEGIIKILQIKIEELESQLEKLKQEKENIEEQRTVLLAEREEEKKKLEEIRHQAIQQKEDIEKKWKIDFEKLRTINILKEQQLLDDFEWKLREVQQMCKKRLDEKDKTAEQRLQDAYKEAEKKMQQAENMMAQVETMKSYKLEIDKLKGLTIEQEKAMTEMAQQQKQMRDAEDSLKGETKRLRNLIEMEKENIQHMQRKHNQEIADKERSLKILLHQKRTEIAMYWEERLLHECGRLKSELDQIHSEERHCAVENAKREKQEEFEKAQNEWELKITECLREITKLKQECAQKDEDYHEEIIKAQSNTDRDILELRRLMDKIDMSHHERFEKMVQEHDVELERVNEETTEKLAEMEKTCQNQVVSLRISFELAKEQMERDSQQKIQSLIQTHRSELDSQWENLLSQKTDAIELIEEKYVTQYKTLEEQFTTQQKSHEGREIELLKAIDSLKNEVASKTSALDDLQSNVDVLEGGIQVLNQEVAQQNTDLSKTQKEADYKIRDLQETIDNMKMEHDKEREGFRLKLMGVQKKTQETIDHLHRKCSCLTKLFEEVRLRYERRESRAEDLTKISDLRQVIAEQEKDLTCLNEEKRYFQMKLIGIENRMEEASGDEDAFEDAAELKSDLPGYLGLPPAYPAHAPPASFSIPPTIPECDE